MTTIVLLTISNIFMTFSWYGHLKYRTTPLPHATAQGDLRQLAHCFDGVLLQVPANRIGSYEFATAQLKPFRK
jgi:uncharacterized protein (DUF486 family)